MIAYARVFVSEKRSYEFVNSIKPLTVAEYSALGFKGAIPPKIDKKAASKKGEKKDS